MGSMTLSEGASLGCPDPGCLITVVLGGSLTLRGDARLSAGFVNVTAAEVVVSGAGGSIDADGLAAGAYTRPLLSST